VLVIEESYAVLHGRYMCSLFCVGAEGLIQRILLMKVALFNKCSFIVMY
jgi:hypothetical protein